MSQGVDPVVCSVFVIVTFVLAGVLQSLWLRSPASRRWRIPLDRGVELNGRRLLGPNKTLSGFVVMVPAVATAFALGHWLLSRNEPSLLSRLWPLTSAEYFLLGAVAGLGFMAGEMPNSFLKRQLGIPAGSAPASPLARVLCFLGDRLDSLLGLLLALSLVVSTPWLMWAILLLAGPGIHWAFSVLLYFLGVKPRWA